VPAFWVTANCIGVSFRFSSAAGGLVNFCIAVLVNVDEVMGGLALVVCDAARSQPARPAAVTAAAAARQAIGLTGFMDDNSTSAAAAKIRVRQSPSAAA
jgi:hypothetical protein